MLSPDDAHPASAAFAPDDSGLPISVARPHARQALCSLPLTASHAQPVAAPQQSAHSPCVEQCENAPAPAGHGMPQRRMSYQSEQSTCDEDTLPYARAAAPSSMDHTSSPAQPSSSAQSSQDDHYCGSEWLAHPEVQASIFEMHEEEIASAIDPDYMRLHSEQVMGEGLWVTPAMRLMTVNWMSEAVDDLDLDQVYTLRMSFVLVGQDRLALRSFSTAL